MIWIVMGYFGAEEADLSFLLGVSATARAESPFVLRFRFAISCGCGGSFGDEEKKFTKGRIIFARIRVTCTAPHFSTSTSVDLLDLLRPL
jgi:hypothetical protein